MWDTPANIRHVQRILDSFERWLEYPLIDRSGSPIAQAQRLFFSACVVVAHGTESDPVLCYGNQRALELWEMDAATFCQTPSKQTAEPLHRDERAQLLQRTTANGFVDDYRGIRVTSSGRRFMIHRAIVWNVVSREEEYLGQAATFSDFEWLDVTDQSSLT